jgi:D-3-phosphoglycerate dehydrogenase
VAEHTFLLLLALEQNFLYGVDASRKGEWKRKTGHEVLDKTIGIIGLGRIGKEVAIRANAFGMHPIGYDVYWDEKFAAQHNVKRVATLDEIYAASDYISLHTNLTPETRDMINTKSIAKMKKGVLILNCARGEIVHTSDMVAALQSGQVGGYGTDVLDAEPPPPDHPLLKLPNCIVTPHIASRTFESVVRQATASVQNLLLAMKGEKPIAQVNPEVLVQKVV